MNSPSVITLKAKLSIPQSTHTILRDRLSSMLMEIAKHRVVAVVAGAGYGKTTLVAQACRRLNLNTVWYRLDRSDQDLITFIHYLISGIRRHYAHFGQMTINRIKAAQGIKGEHRSILTVFLSEVEEYIYKDLLVVLDDYHLIQSSREISDALSFLLQHLSSKVHLVLISRSAPEINITRLIAARKAFEITEKDLIFTRSEVFALYQNIFDLTLSDKNLDILCSKTEGWITGLILFNYTLQRKSNQRMEDQLNGLHGANQLFFSYLEENIYQSLSRDKIAFLIRTSILSRLDVNFCNDFLKIENAGDILRQLEKAHLLTFPFDRNKSAYYYHHLFKNFLYAKLKQELTKRQIMALHSLAADVWQMHQEPAEAIHHCLSAQMYDRACRLLNQNGRKLIKEGRFNLFISYFNRIPIDIRQSDPWCVYLFGRALQFEGRVNQAIDAFKTAKTIFTQKAVAKGINLCLHCMGTTYYIIGEFGLAEKYFKQLLKRKFKMSRLTVDALGHLIFMFSHTGKMHEADQYYEQAVKMLSSSTAAENDLNAWIYLNYGFRQLTAGNFSQAENFGQRANAISERLNIYYLLSLGHNLLSLTCMHRGDFSKGLKIARKGVQTGELKGYIETAHIWNWLNASCCAAALGNYEQAVSYGQTGLVLSRDLCSIWSEAWAHNALRDAYLKSGDLSSARASACKAVQTISQLDLVFDHGIMKTGLSSVLLAQGKPEEALVLITSAQKDLEQFDLYLCNTGFQLARYHYEKGQTQNALKILKNELLIGRRLGHGRWLMAERRWVLPLLVQLYDQKELHSYLKRIFLKFGCEFFLELKALQDQNKQPLKKLAAAVLNELKKLPPPALKVICLGRFSLKRGDLEIGDQAWPGEIPLLIFKYLCFHHRRGFIAKDQLLEFLWPEESPIVTSKRLHVALTKLRHTLEPELTRGIASAYLIRKGEGYRLSLGAEGYLDLDVFEEEISAAGSEDNEEISLAHYLKAESLYRGDLFCREKYHPWFADVRQRYKEKYLEVLEQIISFYREDKNWAKCIEYAKRYITVDPYAEEIYQALMIFYNAVGNKPMIIKTYEQCRQRVEKELDCLLCDETIDLFKQLVSY